jgi:hypothetical protein
MSLSRLGWLAALVFALAVPSAPADQPQKTPAAQQRQHNDAACAVYALRDLTDDPNLGQWLAETIPQMVHPGTWKQDGHRLSYYAPARILVVCHTPAVQTEVKAFLQSIKKAAASAPGSSAVTRASYTTPAPVPAAMGAAVSYPVPPPLQHPKHLFHFIINYNGEGALDQAVNIVKTATYQSADREDAADKDAPKASPPAGRMSFNFIIRYEGEGLIDSTVADVLKELYGQGKAGAAGNAWFSPTAGGVIQPTTAAPASNSGPAGPVPTVPPASTGNTSGY